MGMMHAGYWKLLASASTSSYIQQVLLFNTGDNGEDALVCPSALRELNIDTENVTDRCKYPMKIGLIQSTSAIFSKSPVCMK